MILICLSVFVALSWAAAANSICDVLSCAQCNFYGYDALGESSCHWCNATSPTNTMGFCYDSYSNTTMCDSAGQGYLYYSSDLSTCAPSATVNYTYNSCEQLDCAACTSNSACSFCGSLGNDTLDAFGICVSGGGVCPSGLTLTSSQCAAFVTATTTVCESLSCHQCETFNGGYACSWCGPYESGKCVTGFDNCPSWLPLDFVGNGSCPGETANACENLDCTACLANSACSYCGSTDRDGDHGVFGICVKGANVCTHNDSITTAAQCTALANAEVTVCEALSCTQCVEGFYSDRCTWCGSGATGKCSQVDQCADGTFGAENATACPAVVSGSCETLSCFDCASKSGCTYCYGESDGVCVSTSTSSAICADYTAVASAADCASQDVPFDICPLLTCGQCLQTDSCSWCGTGTAGRCTQEYCDNELLDSSQCPAPTTCEQITSCSTCVGSATCQYCSASAYSSYSSYSTGFCITGGAGECGNQNVSTAADCSAGGFDDNSTSAGTGTTVVRTARVTPSTTTPAKTGGNPSKATTTTTTIKIAPGGATPSTSKAPTSAPTSAPPAGSNSNKSDAAAATLSLLLASCLAMLAMF